MKIAACIPTIGMSPHLGGLVDVLYDDDVPVRLYVNQPDRNIEVPDLHAKADVIGMLDKSIYEEWNACAAWAAGNGTDYLLMANDDIVMLPGTMRALVEALEANPDCGLMSVGYGMPLVQPGGVQRVSHQAGNRRVFMQWCFVARVSMWQDVDARYQVWYGDDDLIWKMIAAGHSVGVLEGVGVAHYVSTTSAQLSWVPEAAGKDGQLWAAEH